MAHKDGTKSGGRKKGSPNKRPPEVQAILDGKGFSPVDKMIEIHALAMKRFKDKRFYQSHTMYLSIALSSVQDLMQYAYPKRKAVEFKGDAAESMAESLAALVKATVQNDGNSGST